MPNLHINHRQFSSLKHFYWTISQHSCKTNSSNTLKHLTSPLHLSLKLIYDVYRFALASPSLSEVSYIHLVLKSFSVESLVREFRRTASEKKKTAACQLVDSVQHVSVTVICQPTGPVQKYEKETRDTSFQNKNEISQQQDFVPIYLLPQVED